MQYERPAAANQHQQQVELSSPADGRCSALCVWPSRTPRPPEMHQVTGHVALPSLNGPREAAAAQYLWWEAAAAGMEATLRAPGPESSYCSTEAVRTLASALNGRLLNRKRRWLMMAGGRESKYGGDEELVSAVLPRVDNSGIFESCGCLDRRCKRRLVVPQTPRPWALQTTEKQCCPRFPRCSISHCVRA